MMAIQEYAFDLEHVKGVDNVVPDVLSRYPHDLPHAASALNKSRNRGLLVGKITIETDSSLKRDLKQLASLQQADSKLGKIRDELTSESPGPAVSAKYVLYEEVLFKNDTKGHSPWRACLPASLQERMILETHRHYGHYGAEKVFHVLAEHFVFHNMRRKIRKCLASCDVCQKAKVCNRPSKGEMCPILPTARAELVALDLYGPLPRGRGGVKYILVLVDVFTKYVKLYALKCATTNACLNRILNDYVMNVQKPVKLLHDHGTQFTAKRWRQTLEAAGIKICFSSVRHPQSNPSERQMRELGRFFRTFCHSAHSTWAEWLPYINDWMNVVTHSSTGFTPYELHHGEPPKRELARLLNFPPGNGVEQTEEQRVVLAREQMARRAAARSARHNKGGTPSSFAVGDLVLLLNPKASSSLNKEISKFFLLYSGPYEVKKVIGPNAYLIECPKSRKEMGIYNVANLLPYHG